MSSPARRILLLGHTGQVGWELQQTLPRIGEVIALGRSDADLARPADLRAAARAVRPQVIVNAAAYTSVEGAETDAGTAEAVNAIAPGVLGEEAARIGASMVHFSTDYVFDGEKRTPYLETDPERPLNVYGSTKLAGEQAVRDALDQHLIFRTSWVYGGRGRNFLRTMLRLFMEREEVQVVDDQVGAPTWSRMIADATTRAIADTFGEGGAPHGTYHLSAAGQTSWHGFAAAIHDRVCRSCVTRKVSPIRTGDFPSAVPRPAYSVLSNEKIAEQLGIRLPDWRTSVDLMLAEIGY
ncbi:MAG TPA: dTDP-4-dehydrorhamnose reductase [Longimicrobiaceae bacterium]|nr:dTDP-4-dehydrorhamnose reductase [Longimicrobiaceae bacterium]